jgi:hypothetical protein
MRKHCRILMERPRRITRGGYGSGIPITWAEFKAEMHREDLERWAEDERIAEKEG